MSVPKPPFHSATEELLYSIYLKLSDNMASLSINDINTLAKLNAILIDADLMKAEDVLRAINELKGNAPSSADTLEKLYNIIQGLTYLKKEDMDTLAELNAILSDAYVIKTSDLTEAINALKGNASVAGNTLEKLYNLIEPILSAFVLGGNTVAAVKPIGTKNNFALPFITNNIERARIDESGYLLLGHTSLGKGKVHIRGINTLETHYGLYLEDPALNVLFGLSNSGKLLLNRDRPNLLINGGWPVMSGQRNLVVTSGSAGAKLVDAGNDNIVIGYNPASTSGIDPVRIIQRNIVIGSEAGSSDNNGSGYSDSVFVGYRAGYRIGLETSHRNTMIGASAGAGAPQSGSDHTLIGYDAQNARSNTHNTLLGSGTRAYNSFGDLITNGGAQSYMTAIGAGSIVSTPNTIVLGRAQEDKIVIGADRNNFRLPGVTVNEGFNGYKLQVVASGSLGLGVSGASLFRDGNFTIYLGEDGNTEVKNAFRINSYVAGLGGFDFVLSQSNINAVIEITDPVLGGTKNQMMRLNGFDHHGAFIRMQENKGTNGYFIESYSFDEVNNSSLLKFAVNKKRYSITWASR